MLALLSKRFSRDVPFMSVWSPALHAAGALARKDYEAAIDRIRAAQASERAVPRIAFLRGKALLGMGQAAEARAAFQDVIDNRFVAEPTALHAVALVWLARARAASGDVAGARRAYQDVFGLWKEADPGLRILAEARKEYDALQ